MNERLVVEEGAQRLEVAPWRGGLVCSYRVAGEEVLFLDEETFADANKNVRGGIPILFPWAGPWVGEGNRPQHGLARQAEWEVLTAAPLELVHRPPADSGWSYELRQRFLLTPEGLRLESHVSNPSPTGLVVQLGFHPYFLVADKAGLSWELPASSYLDNDEPERVERPFEGRLPLTERAVDWELRGLRERRATLRTGAGRRLELTWSERFPVLVIWSQPDRPFVCLEPWSAGRFALNSGDPDRWRIPARGRDSAWWNLRVTR